MATNLSNLNLIDILEAFISLIKHSTGSSLQFYFSIPWRLEAEFKCQADMRIMFESVDDLSIHGHRIEFDTTCQDINSISCICKNPVTEESFTLTLSLKTKPKLHTSFALE